MMGKDKTPVVCIETRFGNIEIQLYPSQAPNAVGAFIWLAQQGLFNQREIRRIVPGFVLQPTYCCFDDSRCDINLNGEYRSNGIENTVPFERGTVALGGVGAVSSASCFFITLTDEAGKKLDGNFAAFGKVISGWDVVETIVSQPLEPVPNDDGVIINVPVEPILLNRVTVENWGVEYPFEQLQMD